MIDHPWINIKSELHNNTFSIKLMNGKKDKVILDKYRKGTGIENVKRRLDLLYPNKYTLKVKEDLDVFIVDLNIELDNKEYSENTQTAIEPLQEYERI
jgi:LytS/YehU family sensor histidine kinase